MATVTISAPEASSAALQTSGLAYLPVPRMSRERNRLPAMVRNSSIIVPQWSYSLETAPGDEAGLPTTAIPLLLPLIPTLVLTPWTTRASERRIQGQQKAFAPIPQRTRQPQAWLLREPDSEQSRPPSDA